MKTVNGEVHIITFGADHWPGPLGAYLSILGVDREQARNIAFSLHGPRWAFIYSGEETTNAWLTKHPEARCVQTITVLTEDVS